MLVIIVYYEDGNVNDVYGPFYNDAEVKQWKDAHPEFRWMATTHVVKNPKK